MVEFIAVALLALVVALEENISNSSAVLEWKTYQPSFGLIKLLSKMIHFQNKGKVLFWLIADWFNFCCFVYICF